MTLPMIGKLLGHTQVQTTQRYAHLFDDPLRIGLDQVGDMLRPKLKLVAAQQWRARSGRLAEKAVVGPLKAAVPALGRVGCQSSSLRERRPKRLYSPPHGALVGHCAKCCTEPVEHVPDQFALACRHALIVNPSRDRTRKGVPVESRPRVRYRRTDRRSLAG